MDENEKVKNSKELDKLVALAQGGDQDAFAKIYDLLIDQVYRYVFYRIKGEDVEDIVENVFLKVWENLKKYRREEKKSFTAWVFRITHNLVVDHYRAAKDKQFEELDLNITDDKREHNPIRTTENVLDNKALKMALTKLKKPYRDVIICKFINELSNAEIAEVLDKNEGSLRVLQFRALSALKKELQEMGVNYEF
jgi:RNA polymerase sigma-70 factor (ECF subfamily)